MTLKEANQHIRNAWITAVVWALLSLFYLVMRPGGTQLANVDPSELIGVAVMLLLASGLYRKSRICAVLMLCYFVLVRTGSWMELGRICLPVLSLIVGYLLFQGMRGSFIWHSTARSNGAGGVSGLGGIVSLLNLWHRGHPQPSTTPPGVPAESEAAPVRPPPLPPAITSPLTNEERCGRRLLLIIFAVVLAAQIFPGELGSLTEGLAGYRLRILSRLAWTVALFYAVYLGMPWARALAIVWFGVVSPVLVFVFVFYPMGPLPPADVLVGSLALFLGYWLLFYAPVAYVLAFSRSVIAFLRYQHNLETGAVGFCAKANAGDLR